MATEHAGPIDVVVLGFPGNEFNGGIGPALRDLVVSGQIRVVDLLFVYKDRDGNVGSIELADLGPTLEPSLVDIDGQLEGGLLDADDVEEVAPSLPPDSSVAVLAIENTWAIPFISAVRSAGGELIDQVRVRSDLVEAVRAELATGAGGQ